MFQHMGVARGGATAALASCLPTAWDWAGLCHGRSSGIGRGFDCVERARSRPPPAARLEETAVQVDWTGRIISLVPRVLLCDAPRRPSTSMDLGWSSARVE